MLVNKTKLQKVYFMNFGSSWMICKWSSSLMALIGYQQVQRLLFNNSRVCSNQYLRWKSGHSSEKKNEQKRVQAIAQQKVTLKFVYKKQDLIYVD